MSGLNPTVVEIKTNKVNSWNVYGGDKPIVVNDYSIMLGRNNEPHTPLESFSDLSRTQALEMRIDLGGQIVDVDLPHDMMARLVRYMADKNYPHKGSFDCVSFAHWMLGEPYKYKSGVDLTRFDMDRVRNLKSLDPGDVVHLVDGDEFRNTKARHAAVYIGHELFLSKLGDWKICVQNIDQLNDVYGNCGIFKQLPKD